MESISSNTPATTVEQPNPNVTPETTLPSELQDIKRAGSPDTAEITQAIADMSIKKEDNPLGLTAESLAQDFASSVEESPEDPDYKDSVALVKQFRASEKTFKEAIDTFMDAQDALYKFIDDFSQDNKLEKPVRLDRDTLRACDSSAEIEAADKTIKAYSNNWKPCFQQIMESKKNQIMRELDEAVKPEAKKSVAEAGLTKLQSDFKRLLDQLESLMAIYFDKIGPAKQDYAAVRRDITVKSVELVQRSLGEIC